MWHPHDFEKVFRETVRLHSEVTTGQEKAKTPETNLTTFGGGR
jgi:hypothetical protein